MIPPPLPEDEQRRLARLRALDILDTSPEERFDRITRLASALFDVPIALVSLVDADRQWFKSRIGLEARETARDVSFCGHTILEEGPLVVEDAANDPRFCDNPLVQAAPRIRFYAGQPLLSEQGSAVGTLCLIDQRPRGLSEELRARLKDLADLVESELAAVELARLATTLARSEERVKRLEQVLHICSYCSNIRDGELDWQGIDTYLRKEAGIDFSHGVCPSCFTERVQPDLDALRARMESREA